jgi:hypothetical protein
MLPRLLFVIGMTIGVMAALVWAAYVSVSASRTVPERSGNWGQRAMVRTTLHEPPKSQSISCPATTTSSIGTAPAAVSDSPEPKSDLKSIAAPAPPSLEPEPEQLKKSILQQPYGSKADQASPSSEKAKPAPPDDLTSTVRVAPALEKTLQGRRPQDALDASRIGKKRASSNGVSPRKIVDLAPLRNGPDAVDLYIANGPHIIVVCSELTRLQKLRMGCR